MPRIPQKRLARVEELLSQGMPTSTAVATCASEYGISERQAWRYIRRVYDAWAEEEKTDLAATRHRRVRFLERIAHDAYRDGQYSAATAAVRQLCRIEGLEQIGVKHQHTLDAQARGGLDIRNMTSDAKRRRLAELMAVAKKRAAQNRLASTGDHEGCA